MLHVIFGDDSLEDLREIWDLIADTSEASAGRVVRELIDRSEELSSLSERFAIAPELADRGIRRRNVRTWAILYRIAANHVDVLRIVHGGRELGELRLR